MAKITFAEAAKAYGNATKKMFNDVSAGEPDQAALLTKICSGKQIVIKDVTAAIASQPKS